MSREYDRREFRPVWYLLSAFCLLALLTGALCLAFVSRQPDLVGRPLTAEEEAQVIARNSPLTDYVRLSPNGDFPRGMPVRKLTIHHMAGDLSLEQVGENFSHRDRRASSNYAIDSSGRVALYVEEANRAWTSGSRENDHQAVTIEVANDETGGDWHVSDQAFEALITLCTDICRRNDIVRLEYTGDPEGNLTLHKMFSDRTECPGPYLESRMGELAARVNERLSGR